MPDKSLLRLCNVFLEGASPLSLALGRLKPLEADDNSWLPDVCHQGLNDNLHFQTMTGVTATLGVTGRLVQAVALPFDNQSFDDTSGTEARVTSPNMQTCPVVKSD